MKKKAIIAAAAVLTLLFSSTAFALAEMHAYWSCKKCGRTDMTPRSTSRPVSGKCPKGGKHTFAQTYRWKCMKCNAVERAISGRSPKQGKCYQTRNHNGPHQWARSSS